MPITGEHTHPSPSRRVCILYLLHYGDIAFLKTQFTPFIPLSKIKNSTLFNDLNNLEPMNKSFAQEATLGLLFLLIPSHQAKWPLSRSQRWHPLVSWLLGNSTNRACSANSFLKGTDGSVSVRDFRTWVMNHELRHLSLAWNSWSYLQHALGQTLPKSKEGKFCLYWSCLGPLLHKDVIFHTLNLNRKMIW